MSDDWYRNTVWNEEIARKFDEKLRRARMKEQYLRIQACMLATTYPKVALELLERYFALPEDFDHAQAYVDQATAFQALGSLDEAVAAYEHALGRETEFPNLLTGAYIELPFLIATMRLAERYDQAMELLEKHKERLSYPVDHFRWHASRALIFGAQGESATATDHARKALDAASQTSSGLRYHPTVGLVGDEYDDVVRELKALIEA